MSSAACAMMVFWALACGVASAAAQNDSVVDLSGEWLFRPEFNYARGDKGNADQGWNQPDIDESEWKPLRVGTPWEAQGVSYDGIGWFRKRFAVPSDWAGQTLFLQLGSPDDGAEVYFNGESLGTWKFGQDIQCVVPASAVRVGEDNTIAIRVWDWYMSGGLHGSAFCLQYITPFMAQPAEAVEPIRLSVTEELPDDLLGSKRWESGWRDNGLMDTSPRLRVARRAFQGRDAVEMEVWHPNNAVFMDYLLRSDEAGASWAAAGMDHLSFWYRTEDLRGEMTLRLTDGKHAWGKNVPAWETQVAVQPGEWTQVVIPFAAFYRKANKSTSDDAEPMASPERVDRLVIGYENHHLRSPGTIRFADFEVGSLASGSPFDQPLSLAGLWRFQRDNVRPDGTTVKADPRTAATDPTPDHAGYGEAMGYATPGYDDNDWQPVPIGGAWMKQGLNYRGPAWYRQEVVVPNDWKGLPLRLRLGRTADAARVYWNGELVGAFTEKDQPVNVQIEPSRVKAGQASVIAVQVTGWGNRSGLLDGPFDLAPQGLGQLLVASAGDHQNAAEPSAFEMGVAPPEALDLILRWRGTTDSAETLTARYRFVDCFHREIVAGQTEVVKSDGRWEAVVALDATQSRQLYYGEWFRGEVTVFDADGHAVAAESYPQGDQAHFKLRYAERDALALPALSGQVDETPYGALKLVDVIDCSADPVVDGHPYKEGGIRNAWVGRRAYATWVDGVTVESLGDRSYREVNNNQFFAYRVGRGKLDPHKAYLLRVLVPDDKARYQVMEIKAGRNYQGTGFYSGVSPTDPVANFPTSGAYQWYDHFVVNDDVTYGYEGARSTSSANGFWVVFHDNGRAYTGQYEAGPAAAEIRLYEMPEGPAGEPVITEPEGLPERVLMMDWERQPEVPPADAIRYAELMGMNAISPVFQKWSSHGFWHSQVGFAPPGWYQASREGEDDRDIYGHWLDATRASGMRFIPRIEYGGGPNLPEAARVIGPNGKIDPGGRYCQWGANILHPATWDEMAAVLDELIGRHIQDNPQIAGLLWRHRQDRIMCSYGRADVEMFCQETGRDIPEGDAAQIAKWASKTVGEAYAAWWQGKRADFLRRVRDRLKSYRGDLVLYYYNWDEDGWTPGLEKNSFNTPQDWTDFYNVDRAHLYLARRAEARRALDDAFYVKYLQGSGKPHNNIYPDLFTKDQDIVIFAPVHWRYLADNGPYIKYFETGDGLAVCNMFSYEEKGRWNLQGDRYESSEMTPGGHAYAMADEVMAFFHGDPNVMTTTTYTYGRGWVDQFRRFAKAYRALPDVRGQVIDDAVTPANDEVRVRRYDAAGRSYLSVVSKSMKPASLTIRVSAERDTQVIDLVTGGVVASEYGDDTVIFHVEIDPMQLNSYLLK